MRASRGALRLPGLSGNDAEEIQRLELPRPPLQNLEAQRPGFIEPSRPMQQMRLAKRRLNLGVCGH